MFVSCVEIYNEQINDLLDPSKKNLKIVYDARVGAVIKDCTIRATKSPQDLIHSLLEGETNRQVAQTRHNDRSSRSHTIFRISLQHRDKRKSSPVIVESTLTLVDLAGSESLSTLSNESQQTECKNINRSLLSLSRVIILLARKHKKRTQHIPYRDSNLTRILQNALGGNSNTVILCTVAPVKNCRDETLNTLRFAKFAKQVETTVQINERMSDKGMLKKYHNMVKDLKKQIKRISEKANKAESLHRDNQQLILEKKDILKTLETHKINDYYMRERMRELEFKLSSLSQPGTPASHISDVDDMASCGSSRSRPGTAVSSTLSESMECQLSGLQERLECVQASIDMLTRKFDHFSVPASPMPSLPSGFNHPPQVEVSVDLPFSPLKDPSQHKQLEIPEPHTPTSTNRGIESRRRNVIREIWLDNDLQIRDDFVEEQAEAPFIIVDTANKLPEFDDGELHSPESNTGGAQDCLKHTQINTKCTDQPTTPYASPVNQAPLANEPVFRPDPAADLDHQLGQHQEECMAPLSSPIKNPLSFVQIEKEERNLMDVEKISGEIPDGGSSEDSIKAKITLNESTADKGNIEAKERSFRKLKKMFKPFEQDPSLVERMIAQDIQRTMDLQDKLELAEIEKKKEEEHRELVMGEMLRSMDIQDRIANAEYERNPKAFGRQTTENDFIVHEIQCPEFITNMPVEISKPVSVETKTYKEKEETEKEEDPFVLAAKDMMLQDLHRNFSKCLQIYRTIPNYFE